MVRPLLSYVLLSYNQESFIREAVASALAQTYSPLEILIQDDCSSDGSFQVIQQLVDDYRGPHFVRYLRNQTNIGIARNVSRAIEYCRGQLVVVAAGDDVSVPDRTETIHRAWEDSGRGAMALFSCYHVVSRDGLEIGISGTCEGPGNCRAESWQLQGDLFEFLSTRKPMIHGCAAAYSPELMRYFGPVWGDLEDMVLCFRTLAVGKLFYIHRPLVKYRRHSDNASFFLGEETVRSFENRERRLRRGNEMTIRTYDNLTADFEVLHEKGRLTETQFARFKAEVHRLRKPFIRERSMMEQDLLGRVRLLVQTAACGDVRGAFRVAPRALPRPAYRALYLLRHRLRSLEIVGASRRVPRQFE